MTRIALLIVLAACATCGKGNDDSPKALPADAFRDFDRCLGALEAADPGDPAVVATVARGCEQACPAGFTELADAVRAPVLDEDAIWAALSRCDLACSQQASERASNAPFAARLAGLAQDCGLAYFSLPPKHETLLTPTSAVAGRVHRWLESFAPKLDAQRRQRLDDATARAHLPLAPPASIVEGYELPQSRSGRLFASSFYIVIGRGPVRAAARPVVRLRGTALELRPVPGGPPPGSELGEGTGPQRLAELEDQWRAMHPGSTRSASYAYLADGAQPIERLLALAHTLGHRQFRIAVAGLAAREHSVAVAAAGQAGTAAPALVLSRGELAFPDGDGRGSLADQLSRQLVARAPFVSVALSVEEGTSVAELVAALDVIASAGSSEALLSILRE